MRQRRKERVNEDGESVITVWSPTDEPAIEEWWAEKIDAFNQAHRGSHRDKNTQDMEAAKRC